MFTTSNLALAQKSPNIRPSQNSENSATSGTGRLETHVDLIQKAQNLALQRDRIQASQVLSRGIEKETKGSPAYKELMKALAEHASIFYTEKAQSLFSTGEALIETKPQEALTQFQEALRVEDGNVTILKTIARTQLVLGECDRADASTQSAEAINPYSPETILLRLQVLVCQKNTETVKARLAKHESDLEAVEPFLRGLRIQLAIEAKDLKKAKSLLAAWEVAAPDYPELYYWKWQLSQLEGQSDRASAVKYIQLCQNLTPRKRRNYSIDVSLCKAKESAENFIKENDRPSVPGERE